MYVMCLHFIVYRSMWYQIMYICLYVHVVSCLLPLTFGMEFLKTLASLLTFVEGPQWNLRKCSEQRYLLYSHLTQWEHLLPQAMEHRQGVWKISLYMYIYIVTYIYMIYIHEYVYVCYHIELDRICEYANLGNIFPCVFPGFSVCPFPISHVAVAHHPRRWAGHPGRPPFCCEIYIRG